MSVTEHEDVGVATEFLRRRAAQAEARAANAETQLARLSGAFEHAVLGWFEQVTTLRRQNADLQAANTALLVRARTAEAAAGGTGEH